MAEINITYDSYDLQDLTTNKILTRNIIYRSTADKVLSSKYNLRRGDREVLDTWYTEKIIEVTGWIKADTAANLRIAIDNLKRALRPKEKNLDIDYGSGTIRYEATCIAFEVPEEHWHITQIPFTVRFNAKPWGITPTATSQSYAVTTSTYTNSIVITGSHHPLPVITFTSNIAADMVVKFENTTTSEWIETYSTASFSTNSVLEIDIDNQTFELDDTTTDFKGVFPQFNPSTNSFTITYTGDTPNLTCKILYYPTYL